MAKQKKLRNARSQDKFPFLQQPELDAHRNNREENENDKEEIDKNEELKLKLAKLVRSIKK